MFRYISKLDTSIYRNFPYDFRYVEVRYFDTSKLSTRVFYISKFDISIYRSFRYDSPTSRSSTFRYVTTSIRYINSAPKHKTSPEDHGYTQRRPRPEQHYSDNAHSTFHRLYTIPLTNRGGVAQICPQIKRAEPFEYPKKAMHQLLHRYMVHPSVLLKWNRTAQLTTKGTRKCETLPEDDGCIQRLRRSEQCFSRSGPSLSP